MGSERSSSTPVIRSKKYHCGVPSATWPRERRAGQDLHEAATGEPVRRHQRNLNDRLRAHRDTPIDVDGEVGAITIEQSAYAAWFLGAMDSTVEKVRAGVITVGVQQLIADPSTRENEQLERARARRDVHFGNLRERAFRVAEGLVGVMEVGGNNAGPM